VVVVGDGSGRVGTGLGKAALVSDGRGGHIALPSEGGHTLFPFVTDREWEYFRFLQARTGRTQIIGDLVVTGGGLSALHSFLAGRELDPPEVAAGFATHPETLAWFARFYGRACRDLALQVLALGGLFVSGGIAAKNPEVVEHPVFAEEFRASETHPHLLAQIPVRLNANEDSGLWGAAMLGRQKLLQD
jgi:glucokinase